MILHNINIELPQIMWCIIKSDTDKLTNRKKRFIIVKNILLIFLTIALTLNAYGQNLVPNSSFEKYDSLPCSPIISAASNFDKYMQSWFIPTQATSDIYSSIVSDTCMAHSNSTTIGGMGSQNPRTGGVMAGIISMHNVAPLAQPYREYLSVKLNSPLINGEIYEAYMYVSLANYSRYATNNIGMYFSNFDISNPNTFGILNFEPQVNEKSLITDTANWVKIGGVFKANSAAQYLTIGNFLNDSNTIRFSRSTSSFPIFHPYPYYFIDDITVEKFSLKISKDTILCPGDSVKLFANTDSIIGWATKDNPQDILSRRPTLKVSPKSRTTFLAYSPSDTAEAVVDIFSETSLDIGSDTTMCLGESLILNPSISYGEYLWQDGSADSLFVANRTQEYWLKVNNPCGIFYDTIFIEFIDCDIKIKMPNVFTPNRDGINDYFHPIRIENEIYGNLAVFNRLGMQMYKGDLRSNGWDGKHNGQQCSEGVYFWVATYEDRKGNTKIVTGHITLSK